MTILETNDIRTLHASANLYLTLFFPTTILAWNSLSEETKQAPYVASFKHYLKRDIKKHQYTSMQARANVKYYIQA